MERWPYSCVTCRVSIPGCLLREVPLYVYEWSEQTWHFFFYMYILCAFTSVVVGLFLCVYIPSLVSEVLEKYKDTFIEVVNAKHNLLKLMRKGVITQDIERRISATNDDEGRQILYDHLKRHGSEDTLREFCMVAITADGFPGVQKLAEEMMKELPLKGLFQCVSWFSLVDIQASMKFRPHIAGQF